LLSLAKFGSDSEGLVFLVEDKWHQMQQKEVYKLFSLWLNLVGFQKVLCFFREDETAPQQEKVNTFGSLNLVQLQKAWCFWLKIDGSRYNVCIEN
jgi:hypothetical protein